jgi:hypothetical protein
LAFFMLEKRFELVATGYKSSKRNVARVRN